MGRSGGRSHRCKAGNELGRGSGRTALPRASHFIQKAEAYSFRQRATAQYRRQGPKSAIARNVRIKITVTNSTASARAIYAADATVDGYCSECLRRLHRTSVTQCKPAGGDHQRSPRRRMLVVFARDLRLRRFGIGIRIRLGMRIPTADGDDLAETDGQVRVASGKSTVRSRSQRSRLGCEAQGRARS
jgi:hypothetical protein